MPQTPKKRGRPREFDPDVALAKAGRAFLRHGYAGTSLEMLATEMDLNKPSLYAAFGDKHALYMRVLKRRYQRVTERYQAAFARGATLQDALLYIFDECVEMVLGDDNKTGDEDEPGPAGCPIAAAQSTESLVDDEVREFTRQFRTQTDKGLAHWIAKKLNTDELIRVEPIAKLANGILHDLALRARVGESRARLREIGRNAAIVLARAAMSSS